MTPADDCRGTFNALEDLLGRDVPIIRFKLRNVHDLVCETGESQSFRCQFEALRFFILNRFIQDPDIADEPVTNGGR